MAAFHKRTVGAADMLGERLSRIRRESGISLETTSARTGISIKNLEAIEQGRYTDLPGTVYVKNFIRQYARFLEVGEETALELFARESKVASRMIPEPPMPPVPQKQRVLLTPQRVRWGLILLLAAGVLIYLGLEVRNFTAPPALVLIEPPEQFTTSAHSVELRGTTDPEVSVTVNGKTVLVDHQGAFNELLDLQDGLNTVVIRATKKRGTSTVVTRSVLVTQPTQ